VRCGDVIIIGSGAEWFCRSDSGVRTPEVTQALCKIDSGGLTLCVKTPAHLSALVQRSNPAPSTWTPRAIRARRGGGWVPLAPPPAHGGWVVWGGKQRARACYLTIHSPRRPGCVCVSECVLYMCVCVCVSGGGSAAAPCSTMSDIGEECGVRVRCAPPPTGTRHPAIRPAAW
jgi:hypothetical protein